MLPMRIVSLRSHINSNGSMYTYIVKRRYIHTLITSWTLILTGRTNILSLTVLHTVSLSQTEMSMSSPMLGAQNHLLTIVNPKELPLTFWFITRSSIVILPRLAYSPPVYSLPSNETVVLLS